RAVIVGSGPSAEGFTPPEDVTVIAVNGAIDWLPRADYWFSLDASEANQRRFRQREQHPDTHYAVCGRRWLRLLPDKPDSQVSYWFRMEGPLGAHHSLPTGTPEWWLARLQAVRGICKLQGCIHTGNSAWGALGLAW